MILGADVSSWQGPILDYSGLDFVYVKITQGTYVANPNHDAQVAHARELGLIVGHYHFPAWGDPRAEAQAFWAAAGAQQGDFLVLDIENSPYTPWPADPVGWCCTFEDELQALSGTWAMDYAGPNVRSGWDWTPLAQRGGGLIDPEYNPDGPTSCAPWAAVAMWQNADTNISGGDSDIFYGDRAALLRYGIGGTVEPTETPTVKDWFDMATQQDLENALRAVLADPAVLDEIALAILHRPCDLIDPSGKTGAVVGTTTLAKRVNWQPHNDAQILSAVEDVKALVTPPAPVKPTADPSTPVVPAPIPASPTK